MDILSAQQKPLEVDSLLMCAMRVEDEQGFNPLNYFCGHTGRMIGKPTREALELLIHSLNVSVPWDDDDVADELIGRCLRSMRPSPVWTELNRSTLNRLALVDRVGTCVYLLTRSYDKLTQAMKVDTKLAGATAHSKKWSTLEALMEHNQAKIDLFRRLSNMNLDVLDQLIVTLLEADARYGLHKLSPPDHESVSTIRKVVASIANPQNHKTVCDTFVSHYHATLNKLDKEAAKRAYVETHGNALSRHMYLSFFAEVAPKTQSRIAADARKEREGEALALMRSLFGANAFKDDFEVIANYDAGKRREAPANKKLPVVGVAVAAINVASLIRSVK